MKRRFPQAWAHLRRWEKELRRRESSAFDDDAWYRFGRNQNIDKQDVQKLIVPRLVQHLKCSVDDAGDVCLDNVDVGGVLASADTELAYLMAVLNAPVCDFVFRIISKPFQNDYRSANKQFIAPLPVPNASGESRAEVASRSRLLQVAVDPSPGPPRGSREAPLRPPSGAAPRALALARSAGLAGDDGTLPASASPPYRPPGLGGGGAR